MEPCHELLPFESPSNTNEAGNPQAIAFALGVPVSLPDTMCPGSLGQPFAYVCAPWHTYAYVVHSSSRRLHRLCRGEVLRLLAGHPEIEIGALTAGSNAGTLLGQHHPNLVPLYDRPVLETTPENLAGHDVVFLALPHGASTELAKQLPDDVLVVDCGADHRLTDEARWQRFYPSPYAGAWPYGLAELPGQRELLANTKRIAVPGCFVATVILGLLPAMTHGLTDGHDITIAAASGTSGAGKALTPRLLGSETQGSVSAYGVGGIHRHTPEILQNLEVLGATDPTISFTPLLAPMSRGSSR